MCKSKNRYFNHIFVSPRDAPWAITLNVVWMERINGINWDDSWVVASKQHLCCKTVSFVLVVTANRTVNVLVLWGLEIKTIHNFDETWMIVPLW